MDPERQRDLGQWFTPGPVAALTLAMTLPRPRPDRLRLLDPACGDGAFLAAARAMGVAESSLFGFEIDPGAAARCRDRLPRAAVVTGDLFADDVGRDGEYDAVVGNPPYVRQERLSARRKRIIRDRLARDWPDAPGDLLDRLVGRGDLAVACLLRAVRLARPGARLGFVVSSALLDAGYAGALWRLIADRGRVLAVVESPRERWFPQAAVNAVIVIIERGSRAGTTRFARLTVSAAEAARRVHRLSDLERVAELRSMPADDPTRWAAALRADPTWFEFADRVDGHSVPLGELVEVRRGVTSGANQLFYLPRERARALELEPEVLAPLVRSPRERGAATIAVDPDATSHFALVCPPDPEALRRLPRVSRYLASHRGLASRPTLRARSPWWALPARPARLFLTKAYAGRFVQRWSPRPVVADQRVYSLHPRDAAGVDLDLLAAVINSTFTAFALESLGRASLGEGALEWTVADAGGLPVLDPRRLSRRAAAAARRALLALAARPIGIAAEERDRADRAALDRALAGAVPGLEKLLAPIHAALIESVARRAEKASSARGLER